MYAANQKCSDMVGETRYAMEYTSSCLPEAEPTAKVKLIVLLLTPIRRAAPAQRETALPCKTSLLWNEEGQNNGYNSNGSQKIKLPGVKYLNSSQVNDHQEQP